MLRSFSLGLFSGSHIALFSLLSCFTVLVQSTLTGDVSPEPLVGWQSSPGRRGTLAILESCLFTIVACTWSILHLNVPGTLDGEWQRLRRKIFTTVMTVFLPEIVLAHAIVERQAAIESLKELGNMKIDDLEVCYTPWSWLGALKWGRNALRKIMCCSARDSEEEAASNRRQVEMQTSRVKWTLKHSYYANMGGLRLASTRHEPICRFWASTFWTIAITTRQFGYLRKKGVIEATPTTISEEEIEDKGKTDHFTKAIAVVQISWLILSLIARGARHLAVSQLEILTIAFAACAIVTYGFAWSKPQGVNTATTVYIPRSLDGEERRKVIELQPKELLILFLGTQDIREGPQLNRIHNGNIEHSEGLMQPISFWLTVTVILFGAIHLSAWNFMFPSTTERILWRIASTAITVLPSFTLLNSFISSMLYAIEKEFNDYDNSIVSLWEDYIAARPEVVDLPPPAPYPGLTSSALGWQIQGWSNPERDLARFREYVAEQNTGPAGRLRAENFEWFLTQVMPQGDGHNKQDRKRTSLTPKRGMERVKFLGKLRERRGAGLSYWERKVLLLDADEVGAKTFQVLGLLYVFFRLLIILLSFISLRAMSDSVYDTTWAKNIPSVQ